MAATVSGNLLSKACKKQGPTAIITTLRTVLKRITREALTTIQAKRELVVTYPTKMIFSTVIFVEHFPTRKDWHKCGNSSLNHVTG